MPKQLIRLCFVYICILRWELIEPTLSETYPQFDKKHVARFYKTSMKIWFMQNEYK